MTRDEIERKLEVFCSTPIEGEFKFIIEYLLSEHERLETRLLEIHKQAGESCPNAPSPIDAYRILEVRVKELEAEVTGLKESRDSWKDAYEGRK